MDYVKFKEDLLTQLDLCRDEIIASFVPVEDKLFDFMEYDTYHKHQRLITVFENIVSENMIYLLQALCTDHGFTCDASSADLKSGVYKFADFSYEAQGGKRYVFVEGQNEKPVHTLKNQSSCDFHLLMKKLCEPWIHADIVLLQNRSDKGYERADTMRLYMAASTNISLGAGSSYNIYLYEDYINEVFGAEEGCAFHEALWNLNGEIRRSLGYSISELCTPKSLVDFKLKTQAVLRDFDYSNSYHQMRRLNHQITEVQFNIILANYIGHGLYDVMLGENKFAAAFITSEWLCSKYADESGKLDGTYLVAGYLKSVEQLLQRVLFIVGEGRFLGGKRINAQNEEVINATLGNLEHFFEKGQKNYDLLLDVFGDDNKAVVVYLRDIISEWRIYYRNGYFHKDNLADKGKITEIRNQAYYMYMLILGSINLTNAEIDKLMH